MENIIIIAILLVIIGFASLYIYKSKKSGKKCIGCPESCCGCNEKNRGGCCSSKEKTQ